MDIVYVVGNGSTHENVELRMSLRSIAKYGKNIDKVIVVGYPPSWLSSEVEKVTVKDKYTYKHSNILLCIEKVVELGLVEGDFLYSSDDHFYWKPVDFDNYPVYLKGDLLSEVKPNDRFFQYHSSLVYTRQLLFKHGLPTKNYSQHCNTHMNADIIKEIAPIIHESYKSRFGAEPTSLIMNAWQKKTNAPKPIKREDIKILKATTIQDMLKRVGERECFSIADSVFSDNAISRFFINFFPEKSQYEI